MTPIRYNRYPYTRSAQPYKLLPYVLLLSVLLVLPGCAGDSRSAGNNVPAGSGSSSASSAPAAAWTVQPIS